MKSGLQRMLWLLIPLLLLCSCSISKPPAGTGDATTEAKSTLPSVVTAPVTETPTTVPGEYPNDPDDDHTKRY